MMFAFTNISRVAASVLLVLLGCNAQTCETEYPGAAVGGGWTSDTSTGSGWTSGDDENLYYYIRSDVEASELENILETSDTSNDSTTCRGGSFATIELTNIFYPRVVFVVDRSGSMMNAWDHDLDPLTQVETRWASIHRGLELHAKWLCDLARTGLVLFPINGGEETCSVSSELDLGIGWNDADKLGVSLPGQYAQLSGGTPVTGAIENAIDALRRDAVFERGGHLILVTDGVENCSDQVSPTQYLVEVIGAAQETGVTTHVIGVDIVDKEEGLPPINPFEHLNEVAVAGGAAKLGGSSSFHSVSNYIELESSLGTLSRKLSCFVTVPDLPSDVTLHLSVAEDEGKRTIPQVESCADLGEGWTLHWDESEPLVEICAADCVREMSYSIGSTCDAGAEEESR